ncbi:unnamed protein product [Meganyctiphanes norvegica]|uniref:DM13 domain-containing protein n=1 Tax=Meganyctiphanes norvegica TaxID=48144 RepID=A0AAV2Q609_MEGNR
MVTTGALLCILGVCLGSAVAQTPEPYMGTYIGKLSTLHHDVVGDVYAIDNITMYVKGFSYDGEAPDAFFFAGNRDSVPSNKGFIIPDEKGTEQVLGPYRRKNLVLKFPITKKGQRSLNDVQWVSIWCRRFAIDFGHVKIPKDGKWPAPEVSSGLLSDKPLLTSSSVTISDKNTFKIEDFTYDGTVQDAIFVMGSGDAEAAGSQVPDEKGTMNPLRKYNKKALTLQVPKEVRGQPIQYFGVWSPTVGMLSSVVFNPDALLPPSIRELP